MEIWKDVKGYEGLYQISNLGNVKSLSRYSEGLGRSRRKLKEKNLRQNTMAGYKYVRLYSNKKYKDCKIHHLVARAFLGKRPEKYVVDHIDNDKNNNHLTNLQYITRRENNSKDQFRYNRSSKKIGVCFDINTNKFRGVIYYKGSSICLGRYNNELEASAKYNKARTIIETDKDVSIDLLKRIKYEQTTD